MTVDHPEDDVSQCGGDQDDQRGSGDDPAAPTAVEGEDRGVVGGRAFPQQHAGDDEAGDHEEDIDSDVAAGDPGGTGVVEDDEHHGHCPEPLDVGAEAPITRSRA